MQTLSKENIQRVFKAYDIRGIANKEIDELLCFATGYALAKIFNKICVGYDHRKDSERFAINFIKGMNVFNKKPFFLGLCTTPIVQFSLAKLNCEIGVMITASHNPKEYNGIKIFTSSSELPDWEKIKKIILEEKYKIIEAFKKERRAEYVKKEIIPVYKEFLLKNFSFEKKFKVVVDGSNGLAGKILSELLTELGIEVIEIACELDPNFTLHAPDPSKEENTSLCKKAVKRANAFLGICLDGDGDRVIFIDERARFIPGDYTLAVLSLCYESPKVITEVKVSRGVLDFINTRGEVILERVGNPFLRKRVKKGEADIGGEYSGHYFFREYPIDDGIYTALKMLSLLEKEREKLGEIFDTIPKYFASPEYRIEVDESVKEKIVEDAKQYFSDLGKIIDIDGVRAEFEEGWILIRPSNTEPKISIRFEGKSKESYEKIFLLLSEFLKKYNIEVYDK